MKIRKFTFKTDEDVKDYLMYLIINGLTYHFDDDLSDVKFCEKLNVKDIILLSENNDRLQEYCEIWEFFDKSGNRELWEIYKGNKKLDFLFKRQFRDFDDIPPFINQKIYGTWEDNSWSNDVCPSFISKDLKKGYIVKVWCDYFDPAKREYEDNNQFSVMLYTLDDEFIEELDFPESVDDLLKSLKDLYVKERQKKTDRLRENIKVKTFEDFQNSRSRERNLYNVVQDESLDDKAGFSYLQSDNGAYYIQLTEDGKFFTMAGRCEVITNTLEEAERWLWNNFVEGEINPTGLDVLMLELNEFINDNSLMDLSADEILECEDLKNWQEQYLKDFIKRWEREVRI